MVSFTQIESPVGPLLLAADETGLRNIDFVNGRRTARPDPTWHEDPARLQEPARYDQVAQMLQIDMTAIPTCLSPFLK